MHDPKITIFQTNRLRKFAKDSIMETFVFTNATYAFARKIK